MIPTPGVEPGPAGWEPAILAVRPRGINMFPPGIEPGTFCVLGRRDNRYTTETVSDLYVIYKTNATPATIFLIPALPFMIPCLVAWAVIV